MQRAIQCAARSLSAVVPRVPAAAPAAARHQHTAATATREFSVPVPWGYIAGKEWGPPDGHPVLAFHGLQDNAGTFDRLAPLLPDHYRVVSYDFPGYGLSTPLPDGCFPTIPSYAMDVTRVLKHLGWEHFDVIGHSLGGAVALYFTAICPEKVGRVVVLDPAKALTGRAEHAPSLLAGRVDQMWQAEGRNKNSPLVTRERAIELTMIKSGNSLTEESAIVMLQRGSRTADENQGLLAVNRDHKTFVLALPDFSVEQTAAFARVLSENVDILAVMPKQGSIPDWAIEMDAMPYPKFAEILRENGRYSEVQVEGTHHVHLNNPERVAPHVARFLDRGRESMLSTSRVSSSKL